MIDESGILHFNFGIAAVLFDARPVFTAIRVADEAGRIQVSDSLDRTLHELVLHLATRSQMLVRCLKHLDGALEPAINSAVPVGTEQNFTELGDAEIYSLLLFIDCFLFESCAYMEVLKKFVGCVLTDVLGISRDNVRKKFAQIKDRSGRVGGKTWMAFLSNARNHFAHAGTPWIAIDRRRGPEGVRDVVVMRENIKNLADADPATYFYAIRDLDAAWQGLMKTSKNCHDYVLQQLR
ncbi:MAG TPA: hypothetical protein VLX58_07135 [Bryobacteraceae bacterium]|nr:hypothetical protein [Bryobacteraceae bacterium]